ncbi:unnamed protein product [Musa acuminata subsp. malaccensis]|uniref:(wild Malaysian banana) hypothetical protein n=1 Tax=Musa acuminata subsp. malaccensis TaxID=214687 RepID=A0A804HRV0_MUSAM|nr:unnamed protein product [Musa acuminata subsp. malaccensis]
MNMYHHLDPSRKQLIHILRKLLKMICQNKNLLVSSAHFEPTSSMHRDPATMAVFLLGSEFYRACYFISFDKRSDRNQVTSLHVMPDFAQVYSFLGSVFDPNTSGHRQKLKATDPIDDETVSY